MEEKIKTYRDSGADITFLKPYLSYISFYQYPYDSSHRPKKQKMELATPSALSWEYAHSTWGESTFTFDDCRGSEIYDVIVKVIGKSNPEDILHVDSAYKSGCHIFLTSDKKDIWSKRLELEAICKFKIFYHGDRQPIVEYIEGLIHSLNQSS